MNIDLSTHARKWHVPTVGCKKGCEVSLVIVSARSSRTFTMFVSQLLATSQACREHVRSSVHESARDLIRESARGLCREHARAACRTYACTVYACAFTASSFKPPESLLSTSCQPSCSTAIFEVLATSERRTTIDYARPHPLC